ncbi:intradiol ring-cleavage dioxygenase [Agrocybe pediades]|nr:intradiol ring-cleavage dioxygenase [Agrocybe pediades]
MAQKSVIEAAEKAKEHGIDLSKLPRNMDMDASTITDHVHAMNSNCPDERTKFIFHSLIQHLHDFVRETALTTEEWMTAIKFLTATGQKCTDIRQEFMLLSDTLGVSTLIDAINNAKPPGATEATVLGPFYTEDAHDVENGGSIASEGKGDCLYVEGRVTDTQGKGIPNAIIDTWETDGHGLYDTQYDDRTEPDCRGRLHTGEDGSFAYRAVVPVSYPIPADGPVGAMVATLGRHVFRPAHLHVRVEAPGFETLITTFFMDGDEYVHSDAVFGVKSSLITKPEIVEDVELTKARGFKEAKPHAYIKRDIVLATHEEAVKARQLLATQYKRA